MLRINTARYANSSRLLDNRVLPKTIDKMQGKMTKTYLYPKKSAKIDNSEAKSERISCIYERPGDRFIMLESFHILLHGHKIA